MSFTLKKNDREPSFSAALEAPIGTPIALAGCTVKFIMTATTATVPKVSASAVIVDATLGQVRYDWASGDTDTIGSYKAVWEITYANGHLRTVPGRGYLYIDIEDDLG